MMFTNILYLSLNCVLIWEGLETSFMLRIQLQENFQLYRNKLSEANIFKFALFNQNSE